MYPPRPAEHYCDVLVVGAGPSGAAAGYWLASRGVDVLVVEKKHFPREKTCGDGLTPRAVAQLREMGLEHALGGSHRYTGLRAVGFGTALEMRWPPHGRYPDYGYTVTRFDLDGLVAAHAEKAGAVLWQGAEAVEPLGGNPSGPAEVPGRSRRSGGAVVVDKHRGTATAVRARYTLVADGSLSRFGRSLGSDRKREWPQGMALRGYFASPRHDDAFIESHLDIRDDAGNVAPGYGWIFPLGDGRVNAGVGLLSTERRWKGMNTTKLMEQFVRFAPSSWCLSPATALSAPTGGRLPMGLAVGPRVGADYLLLGDAAGSINPFNGEGIAYAWETGQMAAEVIAAALEGAGGSAGEGAGEGALAAYEERLQAEYGTYFAVARGFVKLISDPRLMRAVAGGGMYVRPIMQMMLRIMANLLRPDEMGAAERAYQLLVRLANRLEGRDARQTILRRTDLDALDAATSA